MKSEKRVDHLQAVLKEISALAVVKCRMSHERVRREGEPALPVVSRLFEGSYERLGLCSPELRAQRLGCSHTTARIKLQDAIDQLNAGGESGEGSSLGNEFNWLNNRIHLLDHRKGEAEKILASTEEQTIQAGASERAQKELIEARSAVRELERVHDEYVELIGVLRDKVAHELNRLIEAQ